MKFFRYLNAKTVRDVLVQALLDSPMFEIRWRWNASRALAILRRRAGKKVPPAIQRMQAEDLVALIFPDQLACLENIVGEREVPDHPLIRETIKDCLYEAMDIEELENILEEIKSGSIELHAQDLREPSPLAHEILNAKPYAFLDNAPLEERRTNAVQSRRWLEPSQVKDLAKLDQKAIDTVRQEAWPQVRSADELHDALILHGFITENEGGTGALSTSWEEFFEELCAENRACKLHVDDTNISLWIAAERLNEFKAIYEQGYSYTPALVLPERLRTKEWTGEDALKEIIRGRMEALGPVTADEVSASMGIDMARVDMAFLALENDGFAFRGQFSPNSEEQEWCERRLLSRIHRYTLQKLRKDIEAVSSADYMRFLFAWHRMEPTKQAEGPQALQEALSLLEGFEAPAAAWESDILPARVKDYDYLWLDVMCLSGNTVWGRLRQNTSVNEKKLSPIKTSPICLFNRSNLHHWQTLIKRKQDDKPKLSSKANKVLGLLNEKGALFFADIVAETGYLEAKTEEIISELVTKGYIRSDSFTGLRALLVPSKYKKHSRRRSKNVVFNMSQAGRWSILTSEQKAQEKDKEAAYFTIAKVLLKRYGVVFRKIAEYEKMAPPWRETGAIL